VEADADPDMPRDQPQEHEGRISPFDVLGQDGIRTVGFDHEQYRYVDGVRTTRSYRQILFRHLPSGNVEQYSRGNQTTPTYVFPPDQWSLYCTFRSLDLLGTGIRLLDSPTHYGCNVRLMDVAVEYIRSLSLQQCVVLYYGLYESGPPPSFPGCAVRLPYEGITPSVLRGDDIALYNNTVMLGIFQTRQDARFIRNPATGVTVVGLMPAGDLPPTPCAVYDPGAVGMAFDIFFSILSAGTGSVIVQTAMAAIRASNVMLSAAEYDVTIQRIRDSISTIRSGYEAAVLSDAEEVAAGKTSSTVVTVSLVIASILLFT
jgi:hypothetical protein